MLNNDKKKLPTLNNNTIYDLFLKCVIALYLDDILQKQGKWWLLLSQILKPSIFAHALWYACPYIIHSSSHKIKQEINK